MRTALVIAAIVLPTLALPTPARAEAFCEDLWIARNTMFHRAGFCFSSVLGRALFDTTRCTGTTPRLSPADAQMADHARWMEAELGCKVDTARPASARMRNQAARLARLRDIPVADEFGWACHGYRGPAFDLHGGAGAETPVIGQALPETTLFSEHLLRNGWAFVVARDPATGATLAEGWTPRRTASEECRFEAG